MKQSEFGAVYRWYVVILLTCIYALNLADRVLISVMLEPIKLEFGLSDTMMGFFGGGLYAITYGLLSIPVGWLSDRVNRRNLLTFCLAAWSLMTMASGFVRNTFQLGVTQSLLAASQSGSPPTMNSLISDLFARRERGLPLSIWFAGVSIGYLIGYMLGGVIAEFFGWRMAFIILGVPGLLLVLLVRFTVRETPRGMADDIPETTVRPASLSQTVQFFKSQKALRHAIYATCLLGLGFMGPNYWLTAFFIRSHEVSLSEAGLVLGLIMGVTGIVGAPAGGFLIDKLTQRDPRWPAWLGVIMLVVSFVPMCALYLAGNVVVSYVGGFFLMLMITVLPLIALTLISNLAAAQFRGLSISIQLMLMMLFGYGLGSQLVGIVSDLFNKSFDLEQDSLRYACLAMYIFVIWGAVHFWVVGKHIREGYETAARMES